MTASLGRGFQVVKLKELPVRHFFLLLIGSVLAPPTFACSCVKYQAETVFDSANSIMVARVLSFETDRRSGQAKWYLEVVETLKGDVALVQPVHGKPQDGVNCGAYLDVGLTWVIATDQSGHVSACNSCRANDKLLQSLRAAAATAQTRPWAPEPIIKDAMVVGPPELLLPRGPNARYELTRSGQYVLVPQPTWSCAPGRCMTGR